MAAILEIGQPGWADQTVPDHPRDGGPVVSPVGRHRAGRGSAKSSLNSSIQAVWPRALPGNRLARVCAMTTAPLSIAAMSGSAAPAPPPIPWLRIATPRITRTPAAVLTMIIVALALPGLPSASWAASASDTLAATVDVRTGLPRELTRVTPALPGPTAAELPGAATPARLAPVIGRPSPTWPALRISFAALQALDTLSTLRGVHAGLQEANPLLRGLSDHPVAFVAAKAGGATATLWLMQRLARRHRTAAMLTMVGINSGYAMVVARNVRQLTPR